MLRPEEYKQVAGPVTDWIAAYLKKLPGLPVRSLLKPGELYRSIPEQAPENGVSMEQIMSDLDRVILPGMTHWQHPGFHAYFPANASVESILAENITSAMGAQCMIWDTSPAAAELEQRMMEWLRDALGLPSSMEGVIQDSASSASLTALLTAREVATDFRSNEEGVPPDLRVYCSTETHSSIEKGMGISGMGKKNLVKVDVDDSLRMDSRKLEKAIRSDLEAGLRPIAVVAALGTTGTVAVDPLDEIASLCIKYKLWLHVDAAYAGTALLLPEYRWMLKGIEQADSFVFNPHKWMFTNFDCSVYLVKHADLLIRTFEILPEYLKTATRGEVNDYRDWGIPLGRRFRALKLWFVIRSYGLEGIRQRLREHIRLNQDFARRLSATEGLELPLEPFLNFTCFRLAPPGLEDERELNELNRLFLDRINAGGRLYLTHTKIRARFTLRMIIGQTYVSQEHVDRALEEIVQAARDLLDRSPET